MEYYAVQVWTGKEDLFKKLASQNIRRIAETPPEILIPKKVMNIRKRGKMYRTEKPVFPGYVFLTMENNDFPIELRWAFRSISNFMRFLPATIKPLPIKIADKRLLLKFISFGKAADISKVRFDENDRIVVLEGPLQGLEGCIQKVDRRKGRVKVRLDMCEQVFLVDLSFADIDRALKGSAEQNGNSS